MMNLLRRRDVSTANSQDLTTQAGDFQSWAGDDKTKYLYICLKVVIASCITILILRSRENCSITEHHGGNEFACENVFCFIFPSKRSQKNKQQKKSQKVVGLKIYRIFLGPRRV